MSGVADAPSAMFPTFQAPPRRGDIFLAVGTTHGTFRGRKKETAAKFPISLRLMEGGNAESEANGVTHIRPLGRKNPRTRFSTKLCSLRERSRGLEDVFLPNLAPDGSGRAG